MSNLLFKTNGNKYMNRTMFRPFLYVYDNKIVYSRRNYFKVVEITMPYTQVSSVNLHRGIFFATLEIVSASGVEDNIKVPHIRKGPARKAKNLIDQKVYAAQHDMPHKFGRGGSGEVHMAEGVHEFERSLTRLKELHQKGQISDKEFKKKKDKLLHHFK